MDSGNAHARSVGRAKWVSALILLIFLFEPDVVRAQPNLVAELVKQLGDRRDDTTRAEAARLLGRMGEEAASAVPKLRVAARNDRVPNVRIEALGALARIHAGDSGTVRAVLYLLENDPDASVREAAGRALSGVRADDKGGVRELRKALESESELVRRTVALQLAEIDPDFEIEGILEADDPAIVAHRLSKLVETPDAAFGAVPSLLDHLASEHLRVRRAAVEVLAKTGLGPHSGDERVLAAIDSEDAAVRAWAYAPAWKSGIEVERLVASMRRDLASDDIEIVRKTALTMTAFEEHSSSAIPELVARIPSSDAKLTELALVLLTGILGSIEEEKRAVDLLASAIDLQVFASRLVPFLETRGTAKRAAGKLLERLGDRVELDVERMLGAVHPTLYGADSSIAEAIAGQGIRTIAPLREALAKSRLEAVAALALAKLGAEAESAIGDLAAVIERRGPGSAEALRAMIAIAPGHVETEQAVLRSLDSGDAAIVSAALRACESLKASERLDAPLRNQLDFEPADSGNSSSEKRARDRVRLDALRAHLALGKIDDEIVARLRQGVADAERDRFTQFSWVLREIDVDSMSPGLVGVMCEAAGSNSPRIWSEALSKLAERGVADEPVLSAMHAVMEKPNSEAQWIAIGCFEKLSAVSAIPRIVDSLNRAESSDAREAWLARIRGNAEERANFASWVAADRIRPSLLRAEAVLDLGALGPSSSEVVEILSAILGESDRADPDYGNVALAVPPSVDESEGRPVTLASYPTQPFMITSSYEAPVVVRVRAAWALGRTQGDVREEAIPALLTALDDESPLVRAAAVEALGRLGSASKRVVPALVAMLFDDDEPLLIGALTVLALERHEDVTRDEVAEADISGSLSDKVAALLVEVRRRTTK